MSHERPKSSRQEPEQLSTVTVSNSFNPPLPGQARSPIPPINQQTQPSVSVSVAPPSTKQTSKKNSTGNDEADLVLPTKIFQTKKTSVKDLSQGLCSYLWFRRIKEIFLLMGKQNDEFTRFDMELARTDMIQTCEQYLANERPKGCGTDGTSLNHAEQKKLDRWKNKRLYGETFRLSYFRKELDGEKKGEKALTSAELINGEIPIFDNAIWWYSCNEAPIFDQMNHILRLENFELLMCHRYYISDLCQMIERYHAQNKFSQKRLVYRADKLSADDFRVMQDSMKTKDSATITINGFISTSKNEQISLEYAADKLERKGDDVVIMYEITIDPAIACSVYADIQSISFHPREEEILFNMGSTFQIDSIGDDPSNSNIKRIKLTARDFDLPLLDEMKAKVRQASQATLSILLARYLIELGEDRVSKRYLNQLIESKQLENDTNLVAVYNCLGIIHFRQALYSEALQYYRKALNCQARLEFSNNNGLAEIFNYIGQTHLAVNQLEEAKENLEEGIHIQKREPKYTQQHLAALYSTLGQIAYAQNDLDQAEKHFQLACDLFNRNAKISHDALEKSVLKADLYIAFGHLKSRQNRKDPTEANKKFNEALDIYKCILPASHPKVAEAHLDIICEYIRNRHFSAVLKYQTDHFPEFLKDYTSKPTTSQRDLAFLYANIGACFIHEKRFDEAIDTWKTSFEHEHKAFLDDLLSSARVSKIQFQTRLVESAYRTAFEHFTSNENTPKESIALLYTRIHAYDKVIDTLRGQNSFLLAQAYISRGRIEEGMMVYNAILKVGTKTDRTLSIGLLLRMLSSNKKTSNKEPISELRRIEKSLAKESGNSKAMRLRMIINDNLAETLILSKLPDEARQRSQVSFELKQRLYSSNHPSLTRNYQIIGSYYFQKGDYNNAVLSYEKAIEIQLENLPNGHQEIRWNYFLMGDCYCRMDKLELAKQLYAQAQAKNDLEEEEEKTTEQYTAALLRMHSNLSEVFIKRKDLESAIDHQQAKIELLKEILPTFIIELLEDGKAAFIVLDDLQKVLGSCLQLENGETFSKVLHNIVFIQIFLARAQLPTDQSTDDDNDATDVYEQAIELKLKLTLFENKHGCNLANLYEEVANAYEKLYPTLKDTVRENLIKALEETTDSDQQRSIQLRLGNIFFYEKNYTEADRYWRRALKTVKDSQVTLKTSIEKLIEKNKETLVSHERDSVNEDSSDDDDSSDDEDSSDDDQGKTEEQARIPSRAPSSKSQQRRASVKSTGDKEKSEECAQDFLDLNDNEAAMKCAKRHVLKLEDDLKPTWPVVEIEDERISIIKVFNSFLIEKFKLSTVNDIPDKEKWMVLFQAYKQLFTIALRTPDSFDQVKKASMAMFHIYQKLYDVPDQLETFVNFLFTDDLDDPDLNRFNECISETETTLFMLAIAQSQLADDEWDAALAFYCQLQARVQSQEMLLHAINYGILKILQMHIRVEEKYRPNIININNRSSNLYIFDRILLCQLKIVCMTEMEDEEETEKFKKELYQLRKEMWFDFNMNEIETIGQALMQFDQNILASWYWEGVQNLYNEMLPSSIVPRLYASVSTFDEIYRAVHDMNKDLTDNVYAMGECYEKISKYHEKRKRKKDAIESLENAIAIYKKLPTRKEEVQQLQEKIDKLKKE